ncbi:MAG: MMPL family transporter [Actinomycetes bacterium]
MFKLARFSYRFRWAVIAFWVLSILVVGGISKQVGSAFNNSFTLPNTESATALKIMEKTFPAQSGATMQIVFKGASDLTQGEQAQAISSLISQVSALKSVASVDSPLLAADRSLNPSKTIGFATVHFSGLGMDLPKGVVKKVMTTAQSFRSKNLQIELAGDIVKRENQAPPSSSEGIAIFAAFFVLLYTFGSLIATLIPLFVAVFGLALSGQVLALLSNGIGIAEFAPTLAALVGLGVGIDYALFIVTRFRRALHEGKSKAEAVTVALTTSGRAVLVAGIIVCISMLGLVTVGISFLNGVGIAAAVSVLISMVAALTLLPALLGVIGSGVDRLKLPFKKLHHEEEGGAGWRKWADHIQEKPVRWTIAATLALLVLCIPATHIRLGSSDSGNDPKASTTRKAYDLLAEGFGAGYNGPFTLVASIPSAADAPTIQKLSQSISRDPDVAIVFPAIPTKDGKNVIINLFPKSAPQDVSTSNLLKRLRTQVIPTAIAGTDVKVYVGGAVAIFQDFGKVLTSKLPQFILTVVFLSFLLLMVVFRSLLIPAKAALMNLLSISAAFGVVVAGFQWGWFEKFLGSKGGPIESFLPIMLFAILFGLSMDYEVFLVSRIQEEWHKSGNSHDAVSKGLSATGSIITAAATIMIVVFGAFVFMGDRTIQLFGVGLAVAVFLDATIIRSTLVPALMQLMGKWNWYLPKWMAKRLPTLKIE